MALPKNIEPASEYVTRAEFEAAMRKLRSDLKTSIQEALRDMRDMLKQSLEAHSDTQKAHREALEANKQQQLNLRSSLDASSHQREMILQTLRGVRDTNREMMTARAAEIKEMQTDIDTLQLSSTANQVAIATLIEKQMQVTESIGELVKVDMQRAGDTAKRMAQLETRIEANQTWIEGRKQIEGYIIAAARPVLRLPRAVQIAALLSVALTGTQLEFNWVHWLMELFP